MRPSSAAALAALALPLPALGQAVVVRTTPPRATLVCDGRVVGVTPVAFDPARVRTCTLFARGHANLAFDPASVTGAIATYRLEPVTPTTDLPCGAVDPRTGLLRVCFEASAPARRAARRGSCGHLDPATGLMVVCFTPDGPPRAGGRGRGCGQIDPATGLMNVCLGEPAPRRRRARPPAGEPRDRRCGYLDPATGLLNLCFD